MQTAIGRAEGALRSARAFLFEMAEELDSASEAGGQVSVRQGRTLWFVPTRFLEIGPVSGLPAFIEHCLARYRFPPPSITFRNFVG